MTWEARNSERDPNAWDVFDGKTLIFRGYWERQGERAKLAAAAPDLLEVLKAIEDSIWILGLHIDEDDCTGCQLRVKVRAAIAKAEGRQP